MTSSSPSEPMHPLRAQTLQVLDMEIKRLRDYRSKLGNTIKNLENLRETLSPTTGSLPPTAEQPTLPSPSKPHEHSAIQVYRDVFRTYPQKGSYDTIITSVGAIETDLILWREVCGAWMLKGWNPRNIDGLLEVFMEKMQPRDGAGFTLQSIDGVSYRVYDDGDRVPASTPTA